MKKQTKFFVVAIAALITIGSIVFVSCNKEKNNDANGNLSRGPEKITLESPRNANNPYDTIGALHNILMDYCREKVREYYMDYGEWDVPAADDIATIVLANRGITAPYLNYDYITSLFADSASCYVDYASTCGASTIEKETVYNIVSLVRNLVLANAPYSEIKELIVNQEAIVLQNQLLSSNEKFDILSATSVLRHSLHYWLTNNGFDAGMSLPAKDDDPQPTDNRASVWEIALADLGGALSGALSGASTGANVSSSFENPVPVIIVGAVIGAIDGAVKASCDKATEKAKENQTQQSQGGEQ